MSPYYRSLLKEEKKTRRNRYISKSNVWHTWGGIKKKVFISYPLILCASLLLNLYHFQKETFFLHFFFIIYHNIKGKYFFQYIIQIIMSWRCALCEIYAMIFRVMMKNPVTLLPFIEEKFRRWHNVDIKSSRSWRNKRKLLNLVAF